MQNILEQKNEKIASLEKKYANLKKSQEEEKQRIDKLVKIYENMDAEEAANVMADLKMETSLEIMNKLNDEHVAEILMNMPKETAVTLTEQLRE